MFRSCPAGIRAAPRPMCFSSARRRAATAAVSTGRPMPGSWGTTVYAPIGDWDATCPQTAMLIAVVSRMVFMAINLHVLDGLRVSERNYGTNDNQLGPHTRGSGTARRAD